MKKKILSMHVDLSRFMPASAEEKAYMVKMRPPSTFLKDGIKRLLKNKVATVSFFIIVFITLCAIIIPMVWPYSYEYSPSASFSDPSYNNLSPLEFGASEGHALLGDADVYELFYSSPVQDTYLDQLKKTQDTNKRKAMLKQAENFIAKYKAGSTTPEQFKALSAAFIGEDCELNYYENVSSPVSADETRFLLTHSPALEYIFSVNAFGKADNASGDCVIIESPNGVHVICIDNYAGKESDVFPHLFGTDKFGRDYFIRVVYGTRISLMVGFFASIIVLVMGLLVGSIAGYVGGKVDMILMRIVDIIYSLPDMLMVILLASVLNDALKKPLEGTFLEKIGTNIISLFIVFALLYWVSMARLIRGQILSLREQEYVLAAKAAGAKGTWIIRKHLLPNCISVIVISTALQIPSAIFTESYLSFLGLGVNAPMPSLGSLASDALEGIRSYPHLLVIPAIVISLIVLSLNLLGDGLRDAFDPKLNG